MQLEMLVEARTKKIRAEAHSKRVCLSPFRSLFELENKHRKMNLD